MRTRAILAALVLAVGGMAACGGDDDDGPSQEAFCDINADIDEAFEDAFADLDENSTPEDIAAAAEEVAGEVQELVADAQEVAPEEIQDDVEVLSNAVDEAADGDVTAFESPEVEDAGNNVDDFCGTGDDDEE